MASAQQQFSFDVGGNQPDEAILRLSGAVHVHRELQKGEEVHLQVVDADGKPVADGYGRVTGITFKDTWDDEGDVTTQRIHSIKVS